MKIERDDIICFVICFAMILLQAIAMQLVIV